MKIEGVEYTEAQLEAAVRCADWVMTAYTRASEDNGGGSSVDWDEIDYAHEAAGEVFSEEQIECYAREAKTFNGFEED